MKFTLFFLILTIHLFANDSTATLSVNGSEVKIHIPKEFYIDLTDFQKFLNISRDLHFNEILVDELTGDNLLDTLHNNIFITQDGCVVKSRILSNGFLVFSDSTLIFEDQGNIENIWGNDSIYNRLFPYSLLYIGYTIRVVSYELKKEQIADNLLMYLKLKQIELEKMGFSEEIIASKLNESKRYVKDYKGKFIHNLSLSNPDTYIYEASSNKFEIFYSP